MWSPESKLESRSNSEDGNSELKGMFCKLPDRVKAGWEKEVSAGTEDCIKRPPRSSERAGLDIQTTSVIQDGKVPNTEWRERNNEKKVTEQRRRTGRAE